MLALQIGKRTGKRNGVCFCFDGLGAHLVLCSADACADDNEEAASKYRAARAIAALRPPVRRRQVPRVVARRLARGPHRAARRRRAGRHGEHAAAVPAVPHAQDGARELGTEDSSLEEPR